MGNPILFGVFNTGGMRGQMPDRDPRFLRMLFPLVNVIAGLIQHARGQPPRLRTTRNPAIIRTGMVSCAAAPGVRGIGIGRTDAGDTARRLKATAPVTNRHAKNAAGRRIANETRKDRAITSWITLPLHSLAPNTAAAHSLVSRLPISASECDTRVQMPCPTVTASQRLTTRRDRFGTTGCTSDSTCPPAKGHYAVSRSQKSRSDSLKLPRDRKDPRPLFRVHARACSSVGTW